MSVSPGDWGIIAVSLKSKLARDMLNPQGNVFTAVELAPNGRTPKQIEAISDVVVAPEDPEAVLRALSQPSIQLVTLTITEKGYCRDPDTGGLALDHPDIVHDLASPNVPRSAIGLVTAGLARRKAAGLRPFTVLSCDNLPSNGAQTQKLVNEMAVLRDPALADWIASKGAFPSTMVDRITPATTQKDVEALEAETGVLDPAMVVHEPFGQWVIEDHFVGERPDWDKVGAQMVADVEPFEHMKLRCLNGAHSALAYLGGLASYATVADVTAEPRFQRYLHRLWSHEIIPNITQPEDTDLEAYCEALLHRFQNPSIRHLTSQIAMDGSQKVPLRVLSTLSDIYAKDRSAPALCLAVAAWMRYVSGTNEQGAHVVIQDPKAEILSSAWADTSTATEVVANFLKLPGLFPGSLIECEPFKRELSDWLQSLILHGVVDSLDQLNSAP